jgi:hypothetical protein
MTTPQDEDERRFRRYVVRENLASLMNNTKWRAMIAAIESTSGYRPRFRVKCIQEREPDADRWERSFPFHVPMFRAIEWIEFDPLVRTPAGALTSDRCEDFGQQIESALARASVPFQRFGNAIRILGYVRPART